MAWSVLNIAFHTYQHPTLQTHDSNRVLWANFAVLNPQAGMWRVTIGVSVDWGYSISAILGSVSFKNCSSHPSTPKLVCTWPKQGRSSQFWSVDPAGRYFKGGYCGQYVLIILKHSYWGSVIPQKHIWLTLISNSAHMWPKWGGLSWCCRFDPNKQVCKGGKFISVYPKSTEWFPIWAQ